ncbi:MAG: tetratricopeptide repeat protein [Saprospiraceae bacterium]|nr:tetratricopeptide repeat protein [Saprospiraceae bacterium]
MAQRKKTTQQDDVLIDISEVTGQAENFFEQYKKQILIIGGGLLLLVGGWLAYKFAYAGPRQKEAVEQMAQAEYQFQRDSFALALANPGGGFLGFADIVKKYGGTKAGNAALYYAGVCNLNMGNFDAAISYLEDFSPCDNLLPAMKSGTLGDAYAEKGDLAKALSMYKKAAGEDDNDVITPYYLKKVAMLSNKQGDKAAAKEAWEKIKNEFPLSNEAREADKYISSLN